MKYKWQVDPPSTMFGYERHWPSAEYAGGKPAAYIRCSDGSRYVPALARSGNHAPLIVSFCDYSRPNGNCPWTRCRLKAEFATVQEAKAAFAVKLAKHPEWLPKADSK